MPAIRVELQLSDGSFTSGMLRAGQSLTSFRNELARLDPHYRKLMSSGIGVVTSVNKLDVSHRTLLGTMRDVSIVAGGLSILFNSLTGSGSGLVGQIVKINADMERLRFQMEGMSNASDPIKEAADNVNYLRDMATKVPFSLRELSTTFVKLRTTGIDPMKGAMNALTDGIAAFGGTDEQLHRVTLGIQQMSGKSVIQMEEMRQQLSESMPNAMQTMARSMSVSVQELVSAISTGMVQAGPALAAFYDELDRTYGGTAQRMMQTFSGQVTQLNANLQKLATGEGLSTFVNVTLKDLVRELNAFLRSSQGFKIADQIGNTLSSLANKIGIAIQMLYQFRDGLAALGKALIAVLIFRSVAAGIGAISLALAATKVGMVAFSGQMAVASAAMLNATIRANSGAGALLTMTAAARAGALSLGAVGTLLTAFAPWIAAIGIAVAIAAGQFGLFKNKVKDAYEELREFGTETREQANLIIQERVDQLMEQRKLIELTVKRLERQAKAAGTGAIADSTNRSLETTKAELEELNAEIAAIEEFRADAIKRAGKNEDRETTRLLEEEISDRTLTSKRAYRDEIVALEEKHKAELAARSETGESLLKINERYNAALNVSREKAAQDELDILDELRRETETALNASTDPIQNLAAQSRLDIVVAMMEAARAKMIALQNAANGIDIGVKIESLDDKLKRGGVELNNILRDVKSLEAELGGASGAVAEMMYRIERGDFGSLEEGTDAVRKLHNELMEAVSQKEILDKLMEGRTAIEADIERTRQRQIERRMELERRASGQELSEVDKIQQRLDSGFYPGLGPANSVNKVIKDIVGTLNIQGDTLNRVATAMRENTFGEATVGRINTVETAIRSLGGALGMLGGHSIFGEGSGGLTPNFAGMTGESKQSMQTIIGMLKAEGLTDKVAAAMAGNFKVESNFNTKALGDKGTSFGLAQWRDPTPGKGRWTNLKNFSGKMGMNEAEPLAQVKFAVHELRTEYASLLARMDLAASPAEAASMFMKEYERPHKDYAHEDKRRQAATNAYSLTKGTPATAPVPFDTNISANLIAQAEEATRNYVEQLAKMRTVDTGLTEGEFAQSRNEYLDKLAAGKTAATQDTENLGANYRELIEAIETGKLGSERSIDAGIYKDLLAAAQQLDDVERDAAGRRKARTDSTREELELEKQRTDINRQLAEAQARAANPDYEGMTNDMVKLNEQLDQYLDNVRRAYGEDSAAYKQALDTKANMLKDQTRLEAAERTADANLARRQILDTTMTKMQLARTEMQREMDMVNRTVQMKRAAGESEIQITRFVEEQKAAIRQKYEATLNPLAGQMREWRDLQGQLVEKSTQWTDSLASGVTGLITGTGDLKSAIDGMLSDVVNMGVKWMFSSFAGGKTSDVGAKLGGAKGGAGAGGKMPFPMKHSGGIVGASSGLRTKMASPMIFAGAPRYHSGDIIGGMGLGPRERPIIAMEGEGVFTKEQMSALAPVGALTAQGIQISAPISVAGSAGTNEQNEDLAKRMAIHFEQSMKSTVASEIRSAMRPGNVLNRR